MTLCRPRKTTRFSIRVMLKWNGPIFLDYVAFKTQSLCDWLFETGGKQENLNGRYKSILTTKYFLQAPKPSHNCHDLIIHDCLIVSSFRDIMPAAAAGIQGFPLSQVLVAKEVIVHAGGGVINIFYSNRPALLFTKR